MLGMQEGDEQIYCSSRDNRSVLCGNGWAQQWGCFASSPCPAHATSSSTWGYSCPSQGTEEGWLRAWKPSPLDPSLLSAWNSQRLFSPADGKYSSLEPQYLTDKTIIFLLSTSSSQVKGGFAGIAQDALMTAPGLERGLRSTERGFLTQSLAEGMLLRTHSVLQEVSTMAAPHWHCPVPVPRWISITG